MLTLRLPWQDTLFARLFVLLWATLVLSHAVAFGVVTQVVIPLTKPPIEAASSDHTRPPVVFPSLPPADMPVLQARAAPQQGLPWPVLLLDYALRLAVMGLGAWWGARWLSRPVQRLVDAAQDMTQALERGQTPKTLNATGDTVEAQQAASVFNRLSDDLYRAFRSRELLFSTVSHDLRTPMTRMRLRLESQPGPAELALCMRDIAQMDEMVGSALAMLRQRTQQQACQPVRLDALLQALADDCEDMNMPVHWTAADPPAATTAMADPLALRRVLDNVLQNALRHATRVELALHQEPQIGTVAITIEDNGPGIAKSQLECMGSSNPYDASMQGWTPAGHGLGLYIAHDLMRLQGGSIDLANHNEGGLRVTLRLRQA